MKLYNKFFISILTLFGLVLFFLMGLVVGLGFNTTLNKTEVWDISSTNQKVNQTIGGGKVLNLNNNEDIPFYLTKDVDFNIFWQAWDYVKNNYVDSEILETQLFYGAMSGIVASLEDPYSVFLEPQISEEFQQELEGSFEGIGAEIGIRKEQLTIISPLPESPAELAGLRAGDSILAIDDHSTVGISLYDAVQNIRGPKGTVVKLTILHNGDDKPIDVEIVRDTIQIVSVVWNMERNNIAHLELKYFHRDTLSNFNKIANEIVKRKPNGIILDLRNNPGGFLKTAIEVASYWIGNNEVIVIEKMRNDKAIGHKADNFLTIFKGIPTVILINKGSASGSEIVAGALQDYNVATIVGESSFGKGSVQDLKTFKDGSSIKLTIALWLTPAGREIEKDGISPDYEIELTEEDWNNEADPQLDKALEILTAGGE